MQEELNNIVLDVLGKLAAIRKVPADAALEAIIADSLDQMRFLVALEERLEVIFDDTSLEPFNLQSRQSLIESVQVMVERQGLADA